MRRSHLLRETLKWVIPIIVVVAVSITFVQAQSGVPLVTSESALSTPTVVVLSATSASTPTIPQGPLATPGVVDSTEKAKGPNGAPSADRTVLHMKQSADQESLRQMPNRGASIESWFDTATGQGRYEDIVHNPEIHQVTIFNTKTTLYLNLLTKLYTQTPSSGGNGFAVIYNEQTYKANLAAGTYILLGVEEVEGRPTLKVGIPLTSAEARTTGKPDTREPAARIGLVKWLDAASFLPVKSCNCRVEAKTGEITLGLGEVYDIAEWIPRSDLPADFFDQTPPGGFRAGKVPKG